MSNRQKSEKIRRISGSTYSRHQYPHRPMRPGEMGQRGAGLAEYWLLAEKSTPYPGLNQRADHRSQVQRRFLSQRDSVRLLQQILACPGDLITQPRGSHSQEREIPSSNFLTLSKYPALNCLSRPKWFSKLSPIFLEGSCHFGQFGGLLVGAS